MTNLTSGGLPGDVGLLLRRRREVAGLTQDQLAQCAGVTQPLISKVERGLYPADLRLVERLFGALDLELRVTAAASDSRLDEELARLAAQPIGYRLGTGMWKAIMTSLNHIPHVIEGPLAAAVQGAPIPVDAMDLAIASADVDAFGAWLHRRAAIRWNERWQDFRDHNIDPRWSGPPFWETGWGRVRLRICDELPARLEVTHDEVCYPVRPLAEVELVDPETAALLQRYRARSGEAG